ncbi:MAG TPA: glycosyltransferase family 87 protein, partial [Spongiibacteraceae bacterium]|nr:glycosyltransferase family 87 protein [Spongiibacteraceae bacterium]
MQLLAQRIGQRLKNFANSYPCLAPALTASLLVSVLTWYYTRRWPSLQSFVLNIDSCELLFCDYALVFHSTGQQILATGAASFGFFYSAFFAILLHPLGVLPKSEALSFWALLQLAALAALALAPLSFLKRGTPWTRILYLTLLATSVPVLHNFKWGQVSIFLTAATIFCLYLYEKRYIYSAAIILAALISTKYYPAIFCWYFLLLRDWRFLGALILACLSFWLGIPLLVLGDDRTWAFQQSVMEGMRSPLAYVLRDSQNSQYIGAVFSRLLSSSAHTDAIFFPAQFIGYLITAGNFLLSFLLVRRG